MTINNDVVEAIGNTPLIKLKRASEQTGCTILGKAEFMNPGQSVKDRAGKWMILEAEKRGELKPGGLVVESTAGNTGIGLAVVASARGYRTLILIPNTQSQEKKDMLRLCGAELIEVPVRPFSNPNNFQHVGRRLAEQLRKTEPNGVLFADQWNNLDNAKAHYDSTGPEIWQQTGGKVDGFICSVGTGGTLAGTSRALKERNKDIVIACADPHGFAMYELFKHGQAKSTPGDSITEGIGLGRVTPVIATAKVDDAFLISDEEAVTVIYELLEHEGLCLGGSTGINVAGAIRLAKQLGPGHTIVTILCDSGNRYQSKLFNPEFMREGVISPRRPGEGMSPQDLTEEQPGPCMPRIGEELRRRIGLDDLAVVHEHDAIGHFPGKAHFVGYHQHGHAFLGKIDHGVEHLLDHFGIQRRGRLVEQHDLRVHGQSARDRDALLLAARQLAWKFMRLLRNFHAFQVFHRRRFGIFPRNMAHPDRGQRTVLQHGQMRKQIEALEHHADFAPHLVDVPQTGPEFDAVDDDPAFLKFLQRIDAADQRRFARTRRAANHDAFALCHIEVDVAQHMKVAKPLVQRRDADNRICGHGHFTQPRRCAFSRRSTNSE
jgi:cysteine synthase A